METDDVAEEGRVGHHHIAEVGEIASNFGEGNITVCQNVHSAKHEINIALAGPINSGKSAMTVRYLTRRYIGGYDPNIGASSECAL